MEGRDSKDGPTPKKAVEKKEKQGVKPLRRGVPKRKRGREGRDRSKSVEESDEEVLPQQLWLKRERRGRRKLKAEAQQTGKKMQGPVRKEILEDLGNLLRVRVKKVEKVVGKLKVKKKAIYFSLGEEIGGLRSGPLYKKPRVVGWEGDDYLNTRSDEAGKERTGVDEETREELGGRGEGGTVVADGGKTNRKEDKVVDAGDKVVDAGDEGNEELLVEEKEDEEVTAGEEMLEKEDDDCEEGDKGGIPESEGVRERETGQETEGGVGKEMKGVQVSVSAEEAVAGSDVGAVGEYTDTEKLPEKVTENVEDEGDEAMKTPEKEKADVD
ncbi:unnamed protein product [Microthlaspi erraticum]|uniref:Uncharacterized protein n=1 Tax=Microthlaspi erraticum TaxID=1685480 RepID=A0A6D2HTG3_9BRAS|nr:unnamed protein product [Microthlaspi erraticum]